jgi:uncharacterized membrane protein YvbJ
MFCTECGEKNRNDRKFCTNCGKPLKDYTKPRENLLMPEDIEKAKEDVKKQNKKKIILNVIFILFLCFAVTAVALCFLFI